MEEGNSARVAGVNVYTFAIRVWEGPVDKKQV